MMWVGRLVLIGCVGFLSGCGPTGEDELRQWMADQRATTKPRITPLTEPKQFQPSVYRRKWNRTVQSNQADTSSET